LSSGMGIPEMTPQSNFMVVAPISPGRESVLASFLDSMNVGPGIADPDNAVFPFGQFDTLHVARFVVLRDETLRDRPANEPPHQWPVWLAFLGDCDGDSDQLLQRFASEAGIGLAQIFSNCEGFSPGSDLLSWMRKHSVKPAVQYVNWLGRTVRRIREEADLHAALQTYLARTNTTLGGVAPATIRDQLVAWQRERGPVLTPDPRTPARWQWRRIANLIGVPASLILLSPLLLLGAPFFLWELRRREMTDPVIAPRPEQAHVNALSRIEDHTVSNQFSALGSVKPGRFRLWTLIFIFWVLDFSTRQIYTRGRLARVGTIHFARWVFLDGKRRLFFASNYDGSLDSYMDDFINKVAFGLNLVFSNGIGFPRTKFLLFAGAKRELEFKYYLRRHQIPTQVWYKAYPELTTFDLARNSMIRDGLERTSMTDDEARQWLALI
jgi:hypothetical protein